MKLVVTIVNLDDAEQVRTCLIQKGYGTTSLPSFGNFLQQENRTLFTGVADDKVREVIGLIRGAVHRREQLVTGPLPQLSMFSQEEQVVVSGATVFVVDVEQFLRV